VSSPSWRGLNGVAVSATSAKAVKRCGLGAVIAARMTSMRLTSLRRKFWARITEPRHSCM
jgi:hypothetical protein